MQPLPELILRVRASTRVGIGQAVSGLCRPGLPDPSVFLASGNAGPQNSLRFNLILSGPTRARAPLPGLGGQYLSWRP